MPRLDGHRVLAPASSFVLLPEQSLDIRLFAFFRPPYREQMRSRIQRLLQRVRFRAERAFQIADEIEPPIDEFLRGIDLTSFECLCIEKGSLSAASGAGLPTHKGTGITENPSEVQVRKRRPKRVLSTLFPRVFGRRLEVMATHTREQPAEPSSVATSLDSGPLPVRKHLPGRYARLLAAFTPFRRRLGSRVFFDGARLVQAIVAESGERPLSCAKEASAGKRARGGG